MKFFVYLIGSKNKSRRITYVGYTNNLQKRINLHNTNKGAKFTRGRNWKLLYHETFFTKSEAMKRESLIKKNKSLRKSFRDKI